MLQKRGSGILLHISSLPSRFGIGDMGEDACGFVDFLTAAGQRFWQILPLNITVPHYNNSPYMSISAFAGNPLFISLDCLFKEGLVKRSDLDNPPLFSQEYVNYSQAIRYKEKILTIAWRRFKDQTQNTTVHKWDIFCAENGCWLDDFALFMALRVHFRGVNWNEWPKGIRDRRPDELLSARKKLATEINRGKFYQFLFFQQWEALKKYCNERGILIIGDMPLYVGHDSADVWSHPKLFKLDAEKKPVAVSGVPPDSFSRTGQLWGHPLYRWDVLKKSGYDWMIRRIAHNLKMFDLVRLDHFRGFVNYWEVSAAEKTAIRGRWVTAPAFDFFTHLKERFPSLSFVCEDLGVSPPEFRDVMSHFDLPGMRVLQYAFGRDLPNHPHAPHHHKANSVVYTGTHDNNTIVGWFSKEAAPHDKRRLARYLGKRISIKTIHWDVIRMAMMSVARIAIFPMQDIMGLGEEARMNAPGTIKTNWAWRLQQDYLTPSPASRLGEMTTMYGRNSQ